MNFRSLAQIVHTRWREPSVCEACNEPFVCGATLAGCWCSEVKLSEQVRARLRERFKSCLCRACLERFAEKSEDDSLSDDAHLNSPSEKSFGTP